MVMPRRFPVEFGVAFPYGAFAVSDVTPAKDYERSTKEVPVQAVDPDTGHPVWSVDVVDADPDAKKATRVVSVKISARVQPVLPEESPGVPFRPIEFEKLTATAYIEESGDFRRIAWSYRAAGVREPGREAAPVQGTKGSPDSKAVA